MSFEKNHYPVVSAHLRADPTNQKANTFTKLPFTNRNHRIDILMKPVVLKKYELEHQGKLTL